jgi:hypothetical protein
VLFSLFKAKSYLSRTNQIEKERMYHHLSEIIPNSRSLTYNHSRHITRLTPIEDRSPSLTDTYPTERMAALFWRDRFESDEIHANNAHDTRIRRNNMKNGNVRASNRPQQGWGHGKGAEGE